MGFAEQKAKLLQIVADADEDMTGKLFDFANDLKNKSDQFTEAELAKFHASRKAYLANPQGSLSMEEAHTYIRSLKKK